jgi:hypothetical protein
MRSVLRLVVTLVALAGSAAAHHSIVGVYDPAKPVKVEGAVTAFRFVTPHPILEVEVTARDGRAQHWRMEMDNRFELAAIGMTETTLKPGDRVVANGSLSRSQEHSLYIRNLERPSDGFFYEQVGATPRVRFRK